ncbi:MAG: hypothetical protein R3C68_16760 [Myxococcota bacterium]
MTQALPRSEVQRDSPLERLNYRTSVPGPLVENPRPKLQKPQSQAALIRKSFTRSTKERPDGMQRSITKMRLELRPEDLPFAANFTTVSTEDSSHQRDRHNPLGLTATAMTGHAEADVLVGGKAYPLFENTYAQMTYKQRLYLPYLLDGQPLDTIYTTPNLVGLIGADEQVGEVKTRWFVEAKFDERNFLLGDDLSTLLDQHINFKVGCSMQWTRDSLSFYAGVVSEVAPVTFGKAVATPSKHTLVAVLKTSALNANLNLSKTDGRIRPGNIDLRFEMPLSQLPVLFFTNMRGSFGGEYSKALDSMQVGARAEYSRFKARVHCDHTPSAKQDACAVDFSVGFKW